VVSGPIHDRHGPNSTLRTGGIRSVEPALLAANLGSLASTDGALVWSPLGLDESRHVVAASVPERLLC